MVYHSSSNILIAPAWSLKMISTLPYCILNVINVYGLQCTLYRRNSHALIVGPLFFVFVFVFCFGKYNSCIYLTHARELNETAKNMNITLLRYKCLILNTTLQRQCITINVLVSS